MTDRFLRNLLWLPLLCLLACCTTAVAKTNPKDQQTAAKAPVLRIVYCAGSTGHYKPCPT